MKRSHEDLGQAVVDLEEILIDTEFKGGVGFNVQGNPKFSSCFIQLCVIYLTRS
jgi:hypothetical protein